MKYNIAKRIRKKLKYQKEGQRREKARFTIKKK